MEVLKLQPEAMVLLPLAVDHGRQLGDLLIRTEELQGVVLALAAVQVQERRLRRVMPGLRRGDGGSKSRHSSGGTGSGWHLLRLPPQLCEVSVADIHLNLQREDRLVALLQALGQSNHDLALLQEQLLVAGDLCFVLLEAAPLTLHVAQPQLLLSPRTLLFLGKPGIVAHLVDLVLLQELQLALTHVLTLLELCAKPPDLCLVPPQHGPVVHVLVDTGAVPDGLRAVRELERAEGLRKGFGGRRDHGHHGCAAVSSEGVLQQAGQLRVSVGDVLPRAALGERRDHVA
mmetsp:Transcript_56156/g.182223  ORF Transcript_56156/g.182223 Transcript_56156/m.182223 type:complete len:287 (-) Transcript_56156:1225-2085(-)